MELTDIEDRFIRLDKKEIEDFLLGVTGFSGEVVLDVTISVASEATEATALAVDTLSPFLGE